MSRRVKSRRTVEHSWTCSACKRELRGRDLTCTYCGKTKTDEAYDFNKKTTVTDPRLLAMAVAGPNWDCGFCRFENRAGAKVCAQCGGDKAVLAPYPLYGWDHNTNVNGLPATGRYATADEQPMPETRMPTAVFPDQPKAEPEIPKIIVPDEPPKNEAAATTKNFWEEFADIADKRAAAPPGGYRDAPVKRLDDTAPPPAHPPAEEPKQIEWKTPPLAWHYRAAIWLADENRKLVFQGLGLGLVGSCVIVFAVWLFSPWHEHVRVSAARWERQRDLHHRVTLHGEGWGTPIGAFNASCESRQHGTHNCNAYDCHPHDVDCHCHQVADGESCHESCTSGENGFSDCEEVCETEYTEECDTCTEYDTCYEQCPTYDDWCRYSYYDWPVVATTHAAGTDHDPVVWPEMNTPADGETYRIEQTEEYHVAFTNENGTWTTDPGSEGAFERYRAGARWDIQVTHAGTVSPVREEPQ